MLLPKLAVSGLALACAAAVVIADAAADDVGKLPRLAPTNSASRAETIAQTGADAEGLRQILPRIKLPSGFKIALYAVVPGARHMAIGPSSGVVLVGTTDSRVWAVTDRNKDGAADEVRTFAPAIDFVMPNGVCFAPDGTLYIAEQNRVLAFPTAESGYEDPNLPAFVVVKQGGLIPAAEQSGAHSARVCRIGPDDGLYIALGQPYNVAPAEKLDLYRRTGIGGIIRVDRDGGNRTVYAWGIRNSVGLDFNPANGELWFTDNQVDRMGDDIPPGEINRATAPGQQFGFPWYGGGHVRTREYRKSPPPADAVFPQVEEVAHAADLGMTFYTGKMFPEPYRGGIFSAQHGSWNRSTPVGARVMFTPLNADSSATASTPFAEGWLDDASGDYLGRPVDVAQLPDGSLLVSDDTGGALYRISYGD
jgi:glucose/arabinose dehydrogenase